MGMRKRKDSDAKLTKDQKETIKKEEAFRLDKAEKERKRSELIASIKNELKNDPYFIYELKRIIDDTITGEISDERLFESLKPVFTQKSPTLEDILSGRETEFDSSLVVSPESVDMLFFPQVRNKIKEWQQIFFNKESKEGEKLKAEEKLQRVFEYLIFQGQGRPKALTEEGKARIREDIMTVEATCKEIFSKSKRSESHRRLLIKEYFPKVADKIIERQIKSPERLRNIVLAEREGSTESAIEKFLREEYRYIKTFSKTNENITGATVRGNKIIFER